MEHGSSIEDELTMKESKAQSNKWIFGLLQAICPPHLYEEIEGDLIQKFEKDFKQLGHKKAKNRLVWNAIRFFRPGIVFRNRFKIRLIQKDMIGNYFKVAFRNMKRHSLYAVINVMSLAVGLAACMIIYLFIVDEQSFDSFHSQKINLYRMNELQRINNGSFQKVALTGSPLGPALMAEFPEVKNYTRVESLGKQILSHGEKSILSNKQLVTVDSSFLKIFDFPLLYGDKSTSLDVPNSIVLTEETALIFFTNASDALGQTISMGDDKTEFKVTGILKNLPENSHIQFDATTSLSTYIQNHPAFNTDWVSNSLNTYFLLYDHTDYKELESKIPNWLIRWTESPDINKDFGLYFQPLNEIHLNSIDVEHDYINSRKFNGKYLSVFAVTGLFILLIAGVNFMNLTTARASHRWKEIGIRKTIGAAKLQLFMQFVFESVLLAAIALLVALAMDFFLLPVLNQWIGRQLKMIDLFLNPGVLGIILAGSALLAIMATLYPSFFMTSVNLIKALKGGNSHGSKSVFQSSLVILQFGMALALIVGTLIVKQQLSFIQDQNIGFNKDQMILVPMNQEANKKLELLKLELLKSKYVVGVTASGQRIGNNFHQIGFHVKSDKGLLSGYSSHLNVDYDYFDVYHIPLSKGRNFSKKFKTDNGKAFIINQSMAKEFELSNPIGVSAGYDKDSLGSIVGVVDDFKFNSLHHKVSSLSIICKPDWGYDEVSIKIAGTKVNEAISDIQDIWKKIIPSFPFVYSFLDDHFKELYEGDNQLSLVVTLMTVLAIIISCMGLFGLASIVVEKRTKEVGIRKVLGASEMQVITLLSGNFIFLILMSFVLASPVAYYFLSAWLETFAYRISIDPFQFFLGGILVLAVALITIGYHTVRMASTNPVNSLKNE